jgi:hypothetical protein
MHIELLFTVRRYRPAVRSVSFPHNDPPSFYVSYDVLAILSMDDEDAIPIVTISSHITLIEGTPQGSPAWRTPEISDRKSPVDDSQSIVREECRHQCYIAISFQEEAQVPVRSRPVQARAYGVASTSSRMRVSGAEPAASQECKQAVAYADTYDSMSHTLCNILPELNHVHLGLLRSSARSKKTHVFDRKIDLLSVIQEAY